MKTSTVLFLILLVNSGFLAGHISVQFLGQINPLILGGSELLLGVAYYVHTIIRDVRNVFDVDVKF
jgi:hypothetical protein